MRHLPGSSFHMSLTLVAWFVLGMSCCPRGFAEDHLADGFLQPPESTKPWCYWYWISDNISREGISRDLEAMARVGIGEAFIGNIFLDDVPAGDVKVLTGEWWELVEHAIREGGRVGVDLGMFNCPGWSQSGGPWIETGQAMRYLVSSETRVEGPAIFDGRLPAPAEPFQDVAVVAFPAPEADGEALPRRSPQVVCKPASDKAVLAVDGQTETAMTFPNAPATGNRNLQIDIVLPESLTARHLSLVPGQNPWAADCELLACNEAGDFESVRRFHFDRSNMKKHVGPMPRGPVTVSFPPVTSNRFRLRFTDVTGRPALAEIDLSPAARLESYVEKQLGKMHPTPLPRWDTYLWPQPTEPDCPALTVPPGETTDLTSHMQPGGRLRWRVPPGRWVILRVGMSTTGTRNSPASAEGQGLEVDKMNRTAVARHFDAFIGRILRRLTSEERKAFKHVVADSYEMGSQNWTDGFTETFQTCYGYDPIPWLPVLQGRIVGTADRSERFLWDLRRLVADCIATEYVGGLRELCHVHGLELWLENYGHWGFPGEFLMYGSRSDRVGGEFWVTGSLGSIECRAASSCANTYGQPLVSAEAFTGGPPFRNAPSALKARGDWAFCEGINHLVLHVNVHQPWANRRPGVNAWFGTEFNRHNTWFEHSRTWVDYIRRSCWLLQQGNRVADVAYFIGEDTPKMTGTRDPELPPGYDFDYINAEVIEQEITVKNGLLKLPHGTTYRVLVLPPQTSMRPELLARIRDLVAAGATVVGPLPTRSPSMEDYPECDARVRRLADELRAGKRSVITDKDLHEVFDALNLGPDFDSGAPLRFTHRRSGDADIYFVANPGLEPVETVASFRVGKKAPELWCPKTGRIKRPAVYNAQDGHIHLPLHLGPHGSVFVVFRQVATKDRVVSILRNGQPITETVLEKRTPSSRPSFSPGTFTLAAWVKPADETTLHGETNQGIHGLRDKRNDAIFPTHGDKISDAGNHAGAGLAIGTNGVCVFEHGAGYFAPVLVHAVELREWTHVTIVYRDGQPSLYLNGTHVHQGLESTHLVHPSSPDTRGGAVFRGELGPFRQFSRALDSAEVARLAESTPRPGGERSLPIELTRASDGSVRGLARQPGDYTLTYADEKTQVLHVAELPDTVAIAGPWTVSFDSRNGGPASSIRMKMLTDWTRHPDPDVKFYSGKATYRKQFQIPSSFVGRRVYLDLGEVCDLAAVRINGRPVGTLWIAPWQLEITDAIRTGKNTLEVDVVNTWNNRLVGDANRPPEKRITFLAVPTVKENSPLLPAGLLGPVTVRAAETIELR